MTALPSTTTLIKQQSLEILADPKADEGRKRIAWRRLRNIRHAAFDARSCDTEATQ